MATPRIPRADQPPLQRTELERLWTWERVMVRFYVAATVLILGACVLAVVYSDVAWLRRSLLGATLAIVAVATVLHMRERCPRCRARLKLRSGFMLPDFCPACGVAFERPTRP